MNKHLRPRPGPLPEFSPSAIAKMENRTRLGGILMAVLLAGLTAMALLSAGCATRNVTNAKTFLGKVAEMDIAAADVSQHTTGPFYNHQESATGISHSPGHFGVTKLSADFNIPVPVLGIPLLHWDVSAESIVGTSPVAAASLLDPVTAPPK